MNGLLVISLLACVSGSTNFRVQMLIDVFESLVDQTHERFEELEILTIEGGPEKKLLLEAGFSSSTNIRTLESLRVFIAKTRAAAADPIQIAAFAGAAEDYINSLVTVVARMPIETGTLRMHFTSMVRLYEDWHMWTVQLQETLARVSCEAMNVLVCDWLSDRSAYSTKLNSMCKWFLETLEELRTLEGVDKERLTRGEKLFREFMKRVNRLSNGFDLSNFIEEGNKVVGEGQVLTDYFKEISAGLPNSQSRGDPKLVKVRRFIDLNMRSMKYTLGEFNKLLKAANT
jgi:hypothetical protein